MREGQFEITHLDINVTKLDRQCVIDRRKDNPLLKAGGLGTLTPEFAKLCHLGVNSWAFVLVSQYKC